MATPVEHVGTLYIQLQEQFGEYRKLLELVERVTKGEVQPSQIVVDTAKQTWSLVLMGAEFVKAIQVPDKPPDSPVSDG